MKKLTVLIVVVAALAVPVSAQASAVTETVAVDALVTACNGDTIHISGPLLLVETANVTPSGGLMFSFHSQPQGVRGVDLQTGTTYIGAGLTLDTVLLLPSGGSTQTFVNQFHIQATGGAESYIVSQVVHITVNANGIVSAFVDHLSTTC